MVKKIIKKILIIIALITLIFSFCTASVNKVEAVNTAKVTGKFSAETQKIVEEHINDFNYDTFDAYMEGLGNGNKNKGFEKYMKQELGGIFAEYYGKKMPFRTAGDLQRAAEYVWGLMTIYGFDYSNASSSYSANRWRKSDGVTEDAFFPRNVGQANDYMSGGIDDRCRKGGLYAVTNCNTGLDYLMKKTGQTSCLKQGDVKQYITNVQELQVGDIIQFWATKQTGDSSKWDREKGWRHVAIVGEIDEEAGTITTYDAGHAFTNSGNYKVVSKINSSNKLNYGYVSWCAWRKFDLEQTTATTDQNGNKSGIYKGNQVSNCSSSKYPQADQYKIQDWYNGNWNVVLRYPDKSVGEEIARIAIDAANNDVIGYSQDYRNTYGTELKNADYEPSKITTSCWADCSSSTYYNVMAAGHNLNISSLENIGIGSTREMEADFTAAGFKALNSSNYLTSSSYLQPGDILLHTSTHVCIYVGGANVEGGVNVFFDLPVDPINVNFDELLFDFAGNPKKVALNEVKTDQKWLFSLVSQFLDFISNILVNSIKDSILGWTKIIENIVNALLNNVNRNITNV